MIILDNKEGNHQSLASHCGNKNVDRIVSLADWRAGSVANSH